MTQALKAGIVQFLQAFVAWGLTYVVAHFGGIQLHIAGYATTVAALIGLAEAAAAKFPALKPWVGSL